MFTPKEKAVMKTLIEYHLKEVEKDKKMLNPEIVAIFGAEARYEETLKEMLKKLK